MKNKPRDDTEEMIEWRSMRQEEMDDVGRSLRRRSRKRFWTNSKWTTAQEELTEAEALPWNGGVCGKAGSTERESGEKIVGQHFSLGEYTLQRRQSMHEDSTEGEEMQLQQRMKMIKDMTKKIG